MHHDPRSQAGHNLSTFTSSMARTFEPKEIAHILAEIIASPPDEIGNLCEQFRSNPVKNYHLRYVMDAISAFRREMCPSDESVGADADADADADGDGDADTDGAAAASTTKKEVECMSRENCFVEFVASAIRGLLRKYTTQKQPSGRYIDPRGDEEALAGTNLIMRNDQMLQYRKLPIVVEVFSCKFRHETALMDPQRCPVSRFYNGSSTSEFELEFMHHMRATLRSRYDALSRTMMEMAREHPIVGAIYNIIFDEDCPTFWEAVRQMLYGNQAYTHEDATPLSLKSLKAIGHQLGRIGNFLLMRHEMRTTRTAKFITPVPRSGTGGRGARGRGRN
jgi:hypothetical protein